MQTRHSTIRKEYFFSEWSEYRGENNLFISMGKTTLQGNIEVKNLSINAKSKFISAKDSSIIIQYQISRQSNTDNNPANM